MAKDNYYFYISGAISLFFFLVVTSAFSYMMFNSTDVKSYALNKKDFISVSITTVEKSKPKYIKNTKSVKKDITTPKQIEENVNIDDLFSDVWTKQINKPKETTKKKPKIDSKRYNEIAKKVQVSKNKEVESISEKINKISNNENNKDNSESSDAYEVNEYLAKIQATIYNHFDPPSNTQGKSAKVLIELNSIGKMIDFRILRLSDSVSFNEEVKKVKARLKYVVFPKNPNNTNFSLTTNIISKE